MPDKILQGIKVLDLAGEPLAMTGRILSDLGAEVVKAENPGGDALRKQTPLDQNTETSLRFLAWNANKTSVECESAESLTPLLKGADVVIETPFFPGAFSLERALAPHAVWLSATPFGLTGPRAHWRASDLGIMAASGNMYASGFPDRAPVRCSEPVGYAHAGAEAAFAIITALASGQPQLIDFSMQEAILVSNLGGPSQFPKTKNKGMRLGAAIGRTREIWPCKDGFVSFGLRGGRPRLRNFEILLEQLEKESLATPAWTTQDWVSFDPDLLDDDVLRAIEEPLYQYFSRYTMSELYTFAAERNLMLAPANSAKEILSNPQIRSRDMFGPLGSFKHFPKRFAIMSDKRGEVSSIEATRPAPMLNEGPFPSWAEKTAPAETPSNKGAWDGLKLVEFGSGAAGPITSRYFAEHGATVIKVESRSHPEFLRMMAAKSKHGLEGSPLFDALNVGKRSLAINLKSEEGQNIAKRLFHWADAVLENFAPEGMTRFGLDYESMAEEKPDLVMISSCLNGHTGPYKDYPGFGSQGAALSGFNYLTGWPDREPMGPYGTITDSLAPRFGATALAGALLRKKRSGLGLYIDLSQVEAAAYALSPWLLNYEANEHITKRMGNRSLHAAPHGVFPCLGEDRWIALACWRDEEWRALASLIGLEAADYPTLLERLENQDLIEEHVSAWTSKHDAANLSEQLQAKGIEAVPVADFKDVLENDAQLAAREHFLSMERAVTGPSFYERNGFRLSQSPTSYARPAPLLGEHNEEVLSDFLGYTEEEIQRLKESGTVQ